MNRVLGYWDYGRTYFAAIGRGSELRGIHTHQSRPSKIVLDDVEHSEGSIMKNLVVKLKTGSMKMSRSAETQELQ